MTRFANVLRGLGVEAGDRVGLYMPMIPELAIAMLACARIGATHSVVFGGFSAEALRDRLNDAQAKVVVTADGGYRRGAIVPLKANGRRGAAPGAVRRAGRGREPHRSDRCRCTTGRDLWWNELMDEASDVGECAALDAEHPLFILYTSGTTGKPKGVVHTTGGYMVHSYITSKWVFDLRDEDTYFCTADHRLGDRPQLRRSTASLANGATTVMYEGAPNWPEPDRLWQHHRQVRRQHLLHRPDRDPQLHEVGRRSGRASTGSTACACSARSASRSTPRRGSGTGARSATIAARSSIPGGRPRPAAS